MNVAFWSRKKPRYDRAAILEVAEQARRRGRHSRAISEYRKVLAVDPNDAYVNTRIAPLLIRARRPEEAARAYETAAKSFLDQGFTDKAIAAYVAAASSYPLEVRLWTRIAELTADRGRQADTLKVLLQGAEHLSRSKTHRAAAVGLLEKVLELEPRHLGATIMLGRLLAQQGNKAEGLARLEALAKFSAGPALKRIRAAQLRLSPTPAALWRWFRAGGVREPEAKPPPAMAARRR